MKSQSKSNIELLANLAECIEMRRNIEKREKELKEALKAVMLEDPVLEAGDYVALVVSRQRSSVNVSALKDYLGPKIANFMVLSEYSILEIRPLKLVKN